MRIRFLSLAVVFLAATFGSAEATELKVSFENLAPEGGFTLTPLWVGFHEGGFDLFSPGSAASAGLELLAEEGDASTLSGEFAGAGRVAKMGIGNSAGFGEAPVVEPGETAVDTVSVVNGAANAFFSYASMVIPSNDAFIGNGDPTAYQVFDAAGNFTGPVVIDVLGQDIWDAGTEVNDTMGAAFSTIGGVGTDEDGTVAPHQGLDNFELTGTPTGTIADGAAPAAGILLGRITVDLVPEPNSLLALSSSGLIAIGFARRRRGRRSVDRFRR